MARNTSTEWTDRKLKRLEKRIHERYTDAEKSLSKEIDAFFNGREYTDADGNKRRGKSLAEKSAEYKALVDSGDKTEDEYRQWLLNQASRGERFTAMRDRCASIATNAKEEAIALVNETTLGVYADNRNYEGYRIEMNTGSKQFTVIDEHTTQRLLTEKPNLMPYYPKAKAVARGIDLKYGQEQITKCVTSGIIRGGSIPSIATSLRDRITDMGYSSSVRAARTAVTGAQNAGRMAAYADAEAMGLKFKKQWVSTLDSRTRHEHQLLDGQQVEPDEPFYVDGEKIMFPGDPSASPHLVYNCRCTVKSVFPDHGGNGERRAKDPETGEWEIVPQMTYQEWIASKNTSNNSIESFENDGKIKIGIQFFANRGISKQTDKELQKSIKSWESNIRNHTDKVSNPEKYDSEWGSKSEQQRNGLIRHWKHEIKKFQENKDGAKSEIERRKQNGR